MANVPAPTSSFHGKVICLTGGASGIGWATAKFLYSRGASISIADIDQSALDAAAAFFNHGDPVNTDGRVMLSRVDVGNRAQVDGWIRETVQRFGRLTGAVNGAGVIGRHHGLRAVGELEDEEWDNILRVNLTGMMFCLRAEIKAILEGVQKDSGMEGGSVVCVSSIQGQIGFAKHAAYAASKHGVQGLAKSAAKEYGAKSIRVNLVAPGTIDTPLVQKRNAFLGTEPPEAETPIKRMGTSEETANAIAWLLSDEASFVTGATLSVDGGWNC